MRIIKILIITIAILACRGGQPPTPLPTPVPISYSLIKPPESVKIYIEAPRGSGCERLARTKPAFITFNKLYQSMTVYGTSLGNKPLNCAGLKDHNGQVMSGETLYKVVLPEHYGRLTELTESFWVPESAIKRLQ